MKKSMFFITIVGVLLFVVSVESTEAKFRALLVGINYKNAPNPKTRLSGAINDVQAMHALMTKTLGIAADSIKMLTEEQATRENIRKTFGEWLIEGTEPGDVVFFMYSGHGGQEEVSDEVREKLETLHKLPIEDPLKPAEQQRQFIEYLVPYDTIVYTSEEDAALPILDLEFHHLLSALKDREVHLFLDSCFSAAITRDFAAIKVKERYVDLPWDLWQYSEKFPAGVLPGLFEKRSRAGFFRGPQDDVEWYPDYAFFAAVKYFQKAIDLGEHGAFTWPVLKLIETDPTANYTNREVLEVARKIIHEVMNISAADQEPMFYGPKGTLDKPFVLLAQRSPAATPPTPTPTVPTPTPTVPAPTPTVPALPAQPLIAARGTTGVLVTGPEGTIPSWEGQEWVLDLLAEIKNSGYLRLDENQPDVIVEVLSQKVDIHSAFGRRLKTIPAGADPVPRVMHALEGIHIVRQLATLENLAAPFAVDLWIDEPGKIQFSTSDRVTLYYRVNGLPKGEKAYLTLLNVAPDGTVAILYPQKQDFAPGIGTKLYFNAEVETGKVYSIPKTRQALKSGQNVAMDLRLRLEAGQEYFKAVVTSEPVDWEQLGVGTFQSMFQGPPARGLADIVVDTVEHTMSPVSWAAGSLRVEVQ